MSSAFVFLLQAVEVGDSRSLKIPVKKYSNSKTKKEIKIRKHCFLEKLSDSKLAKFQPNWFLGCWLGVQNIPSTCPDFYFKKKVEKDFWRCNTREEIITDFNTKAVNVDAYQRRDNNSDTAGKGHKRNPTTDEQLFISKALLRSILTVVEKASLVICDRQLSLSHRTSQVEPSPLLLDTISKSSILPWKNWQQTASWSFEASLPLQ